MINIRGLKAAQREIHCIKVQTFITEPLMTPIFNFVTLSSNRFQPMSDWDQNERLYETNSEEFFKRLEEERNQKQNQDQAEEQNSPINAITSHRGFNTKLTTSEKTCITMTNRPWIKYRIQTDGNIIYYSV